MNRLHALILMGLLTLASAAEAQVPGQLVRFGTTGAYAPQIANCVEIMAMNSSGQTVTDSSTPCAPSILSTAYTNTLATTYTAVLALPVTAASTTNVAECDLVWEDSSTSGTATFAVGLSATPTALWVQSGTTGSAYAAPGYYTITNTTTTAVTGALTTAVINTPYKVHFNLTLANTSTAPNTLTIYAQSNSASYTLTVEPGSFCAWIP